MTRINFLLATLAVAMIATTPAAHAQVACLGSATNCNVHVVAAGASAQFTQAAIAADTIAQTEITTNVGNGTWTAGSHCIYHWSAKNSSNLVDNRGSFPIPLEPGNIWIVWIAACSDATGNTTPSDIWLDVSVDSTVGVRAFLAQQTTANGGSGVAVETIPAAAGNLLGTGVSNLWPDNNPDVSLLTAPNVSAAVGTDQTGIKDVHVNTGVTNLRPEDAYFATARTLGKLNATRTGLGYGTSDADVGNSILTSEGTGTKATPVKFALSGDDPISKEPVRSFVTVPIGAAPVIFVFNNNGNATVKSLFTGTLGTGLSAGAGKYFAANLFDGSTSCDTSSKAFGGAGNGSGTPIHLFLREPLSGDGNTAEFNVFRTTGNTTDSQEQNVNPATANPLSSLACGASNNLLGDRSRAIGAGEVVGSSTKGILGTAYGLGYFSFSFTNASKFGGAAKYNYLTVDGVDPLGGSLANAAQTLPNCPGPCTAAAEWGLDGSGNPNPSFPTLRSGQYKVWSLYRWLTPTDEAGETDLYGPAHLAQSAQDHVDTSVADFVPFATSPAAAYQDGLDVYRSHFSVTGLTTISPDNGTITTTTTSEGVVYQTLGGDGEAGGDMGGLIEGPYPWTTAWTGDETLAVGGTVVTGEVKISSRTPTIINWYKGLKFNGGKATGPVGCHYPAVFALAPGAEITVNTVPPQTFTVTAVNTAGTALTVTPAATAFSTTGATYSVSQGINNPGVLCAKE